MRGLYTPQTYSGISKTNPAGLSVDYFIPGGRSASRFRKRLGGRREEEWRRFALMVFQTSSSVAGRGYEKE